MDLAQVAEVCAVQSGGPATRQTRVPVSQQGSLFGVGRLGLFENPLQIAILKRNIWFGVGRLLTSIRIRCVGKIHALMLLMETRGDLRLPGIPLQWRHDHDASCLGMK